MQVYVLLNSSGECYGVTKSEDIADWFLSLDAAAHSTPEFKVGDVSSAYAEFGDPDDEDADEDEEPDSRDRDDED